MKTAAHRRFRRESRCHAAAALAAAALAAASPASAASFHGKVRFDGPPPQRPTIYMTSDPSCDKLYPKGRPADVVLVGDGGGLANVFVYVKQGLPKDYVAPPPPGSSAVIDQKGCAYVPHAIGVRAGQEIELRNGDPTIHNIAARPTYNTAFNDPMPVQDQVIRKAFPNPEVAVKLKCDIHPWMSAYVGVFADPFFAVTGADGSFRIDGLPKGEYTVEAWHESLGQRTVKVKVDDKDDAALDFSFAGN